MHNFFSSLSIIFLFSFSSSCKSIKYDCDDYLSLEEKQHLLEQRKQYNVSDFNNLFAENSKSKNLIIDESKIEEKSEKLKIESKEKALAKVLLKLPQRDLKKIEKKIQKINAKNFNKTETTTPSFNFINFGGKILFSLIAFALVIALIALFIYVGAPPEAWYYGLYFILFFVLGLSGMLLFKF